MAKNLTAKIYMVGSTAGVEVEIKDKEKFLNELKKLSSDNDFYLHSDEDLSLIHISEPTRLV